MADYIYLLENRLSPAQRTALRNVGEVARAQRAYPLPGRRRGARSHHRARPVREISTSSSKGTRSNSRRIWNRSAPSSPESSSPDRPSSSAFPATSGWRSAAPTPSPSPSPASLSSSPPPSSTTSAAVTSRRTPWRSRSTKAPTAWLMGPAQRQVAVGHREPRAPPGQQLRLHRRSRAHDPRRSPHGAASAGPSTRRPSPATRPARPRATSAPSPTSIAATRPKRSSTKTILFASCGGSRLRAG